jgi:hypothetical protein
MPMCDRGRLGTRGVIARPSEASAVMTRSCSPNTEQPVDGWRQTAPGPVIGVWRFGARVNNVASCAAS